MSTVWQCTFYQLVHAGMVHAIILGMTCMFHVNWQACYVGLALIGDKHEGKGKNS